MKPVLTVSAMTLLLAGLPADTVLAQDLPMRDYGDAPEGVIAYPSTGQMGAFPTCRLSGPVNWIEHDNFGAWFGPAVDLEQEGNAGLCPGFAPYDNDECFNDNDAGLVMPPAYTIVGGAVQPCTQQQGALGGICQQANWGTDIDIDIHNTMPNHEPYLPGYVNVLVDWDQDGDWGGSSACQGGPIPEHALVNFFVPALYIGPLSALGPPGFTIGPNSGHVWVRFSISESPVPTDWDGEAVFEDGESEDYLLRIEAPGRSVPTFSQLGVAILVLIMLAAGLFAFRRRQSAKAERR